MYGAFCFDEDAVIVVFILMVVVMVVFLIWRRNVAFVVGSS